MTSAPISHITKFNFADATRLTRKRQLGDFTTILNYANTLSDGLRVRRGYAAFPAYAAGSVATDGIVYPTGVPSTLLFLPLVCHIESPSKQNVFLLCMGTDPQIWMYPWWKGSVKQNTSMALSESYLPGFVGSAFGLVVTAPETTAHAFKIANITFFGGSTTNGYYNGWKVYNATAGKTSLVKSYTYNAATLEGTFACVDQLDSGGLDFKNIHTYEFYRNYHDNQGFAPTYNLSHSDPPCAVVDNSIIFFSGGQGSDSNLMGSIIYPRMNKTFFPGVTEGGNSRSFTMNGTYVCEERAKKNDLVKLMTNSVLPASATHLAALKTYWIGVAPIYDGGNIGELQRYETTTLYGGLGGWTNNYQGNDAGFGLDVRMDINVGALNKTVQGYAIYLAQDAGDTRLSGRQTQYFYIGQISITSVEQSVFSTASWSYVAASGVMRITFTVNGDVWAKRGSTYETDSGMAEIQTDTSYAYSGRQVVGGRHFLYNTYVASTSENDRQNIFTNPVGQNSAINSGIIARRVFPNEDGFYKLRCEPDVGTRINGIVPISFDEFLVLKETGVISSRIFTTEDLIPELVNRIVDHKIGCSTFNGFAISNQEEIYFAGYDDCYVYKQGQLLSLIEREDSKDWLYTYREVLTNTQKENVTVIWLPQNLVMWDFNQTAPYQFILDRGGWTQAAYYQSSGLTSTEFFQYPIKLNNGVILALGNNNKGLRQFQNPSTGAFYSTDAGIAIKSQLDTGNFNFGHDKDFVFNKLIFNKTFDANPSGTLDVQLWRDRVLLRNYTSLDKSKIRLYVHSVIGDKKIGFEWRFIYNSNSAPELATGAQLQIDSIELYGEIRSRSKRATEITTPQNQFYWDIDSWDGGKVYG